jgi:hypothetical protein
MVGQDSPELEHANLHGGLSHGGSLHLGQFLMLSKMAKNSGDSLTFPFWNTDSRCNVFDPCFAELDCRDVGAPLAAHLRKPVQIQEFLLQDEAPKAQPSTQIKTVQ